jgi:hypothetical protein
MQNRTSRMGQAEQDKRTELAELDNYWYWQKKTARTGLPGKDCQDRPARTGLPGQACQDRTDRTGLPGQGCQNRAVRTGLLG